MVIIGILLRDNLDKLCVKKELFEFVKISGGIPVGIYLEDYKSYLDICSGFILPGGTDYSKDELDFINLLYENNKVVLGICLGMQAMGVSLGGNITDVCNHSSNYKYVHEIIIDKNSKLGKILGTNRVLVNSRHKSAIMNSNLNVSARSLDNIIEAVEDENHRFFIGVQWHPESLINDINSRKLFASFIEAAKGE